MPRARDGPRGGRFGGHLVTPGATAPAVAYLPWGPLFDEDYLDNLDIPLAEFCTSGSGGHLFNFVEAAQSAGMRTVLVLFSRRVTRLTRYVNAPTGATVVVVPASPWYRAVRDRRHWPRVQRVLRWAGAAVRDHIMDVTAYLSTPVVGLARLLRREGCAAVVCQEYESTRFDVSVLLGRLLRIPVFATFQGGDWLEGAVQQRWRPWTMHHCAGLIIAPGTEIQRVQERYGVPRERIAQIFNPLDSDAFDAPSREEARSHLGIPASARVAVWHGRVARSEKGLDVLLDAWSRVRAARHGADLRLLMVGSGRDAGWLRERLANGAEGVHWRDEFVRERSELRLYLAAGDVYAFASRHEGFAVAPLEAMACGLPVVAADAQGIRDLLGNGLDHGGIVVPTGDAGALADALGRVLDTPELARELGERARARVAARCSLEVVGRQLRAFLLPPSVATPGER